ncbi:polynucleotide 3'-phosphatase ZDP isoform X2 [Brassica napus]|nr:polynucleotide 3'-phosphatase ZDP isoform X2 [Brassica napus]
MAGKCELSPNFLEISPNGHMVLTSFVFHHSHSSSLSIIHSSNLFFPRTRRKVSLPSKKMPIVAEYAKSNRSSCKACSKAIASKTLRVGMISKGPGGFDMTRWHHLECFPTDSVAIDSVDDVKGLSALEKDDQDALAKLVEQCGERAKEVDEKEEEIKDPGSDEISGEKVKEAKGSSASASVIAEYAKSSRSSCKKCSQTIAARELRLGMVTRDSRGFDMTKWHHLGCFPVESVAVDSVEEIGGFSSLQSDDQDALKEFVLQCGKKTSVDKMEEVNDESVADKGQAEETNKRKHSQVEEEVEIKKAGSDEKSGQKVKETKGSSASSKVIAEYAKSSRSSCKKCSQPIAAKELRLGMVTRDSRGFDMTKWHHLGCFPVESVAVDSVEHIGGFSSLQNGDQDALKELVQQCVNKTLKMDEDNDETGTDHHQTEETNKRKHSQVGEIVVEDELQTNANQPGTRKPKMNTSESTSQVVAEAEISFSASDVKEKYRDASLLPKWKAFETVIFLERDDGLNDSEKIAAFDFDGCLANTSVKKVGADAWSLMYPSIPEKLQSLYSQGYKLVIFTNESNIDRWKNKRQAAVDSKIGRLNSFIKRVEVPIQVFIACGVASSGGKDDLYRKPKPGMWQLMKKHFNSGIEIDMDKSFYVGDAAGRKGDHSDADIKFAQANGLKFFTPEEYFIA